MAISNNPRPSPCDFIVLLRMITFICIKSTKNTFIFLFHNCTEFFFFEFFHCKYSQKIIFRSLLTTNYVSNVFGTSHVISQKRHETKPPRLFKLFQIGDTVFGNEIFNPSNCLELRPMLTRPRKQKFFWNHLSPSK